MCVASPKPPPPPAAPPPPPAPTPAAKEAETATRDARRDEGDRRRAQRGRQSTILTSPLGQSATDAVVARGTVLGS